MYVIFNFIYQDWLEKHGRQPEPHYMPPPPRVKPVNQLQPECRLCEEFPIFNKNTDFHKHLAECHFRMELNNELPQVSRLSLIGYSVVVMRVKALYVIQVCFVLLYYYYY